MKKFTKLIFMFGVMVAYQEMTIRWSWAPPPPPIPGTPLDNNLMHLATIGGVFGYGAWRMRKK